MRGCCEVGYRGGEIYGIFCGGWEGAGLRFTACGLGGVGTARIGYRMCGCSTISNMNRGRRGICVALVDTEGWLDRLLFAQRYRSIDSSQASRGLCGY